MLKYSYTIVFFCLAILWCNNSFAQTKDSLRFPIQDRRGDAISAPNKNPFDIKDTGLVKRKTEYDPKTKSYFVSEKIGNIWYRKPAAISFEDFWKLEAKKSENDYFKKRANALSLLNQKSKRPPLQTYPKLFDRIFGLTGQNLKVDIRPSGEVNVMAGY
ncbi:MAG: hypothetical protein B7Z27_01540, partial [Sphingobacteriia bacterium 32-37-4]